MTPAFMPPPLNLLVMVLIVIFYVVERIIDCILRCCCRQYHSVFDEPFDLAVCLMPTFMKLKRLELNEEIVCGEQDCDQLQWRIITHKGLTWSKFEKYEEAIMHHVVEFQNPVSVNNSVGMQRKWKLDVLDLYRKGLINLEQFDYHVDSKYTHRAQQGIDAYDGDDWDLYFQTPYWICGYCRSYVKASTRTVKNFQFFLAINPTEKK
eukprot:139287_1